MAVAAVVRLLHPDISRFIMSCTPVTGASRRPGSCRQGINMHLIYSIQTMHYTGQIYLKLLQKKTFFIPSTQELYDE